MSNDKKDFVPDACMLNMNRQSHPERFGADPAATEEPTEEHAEECPGCEELRSEKAAVEQELEAYRGAVSDLSKAVRDTQNALYESSQENRAWRKLADVQEAIVELKSGIAPKSGE